MPILATCPGNRQAAGFTLLELVVVLAIVAALGAIVMPSLMNMHEAWRRRIDFQDVLDQLQGLGYRTRLDAVETVIGPAGVVPAGRLLLPDGWSLSAREPVIYWQNGVCLGGQVDLSHAGRTEVLQLDAPLCRMEQR
ncbi:hypothetical protein D9M68_125460 [compost metagenome]|uniref:General secretion pathway protein G n=1 Tax=Pseudomonas jinjuensis TaxID=198616 RepID=A0A1G9YEC3_9PSED|nr:type II secretion system protein [Pseudomonas jinjuensis]SDN07430.1 general secretion pathway protein G [Pseudomonas jinjuensis]